MAGLRCRPGDLAVVIAGSQRGLMVNVLRLAEWVHPRTLKPAWHVRTLGPCEVTLVDMATGRPHSVRQMPPGIEVCWPDDELQPIRPPAPPIAAPAPARELELTP